MSVLSLFCGLCGCKDTPKNAEHSLSEITAVSISCGHMDLRFGYSFAAYIDENNIWFLDSDCFINDHEDETTFEGCEISGEDRDELFEILTQNNSIVYAENYNHKKFRINVADDTSYGFAMTFSDGNQYVTYEQQDDLESFFYRITEKYAQTNS